MIPGEQPTSFGGAADVAVVGDGPAGSALACALRRRGVDVVLVGPGHAWPATYTTWADDIEQLALLDGASPWAHRFDRITVRLGRERHIERAYGVIDNAALQSHLWRDLPRVVGTVERSSDVSADLVVDATGWPPKLDRATVGENDRAPSVGGWQTAFGVVLEAPPDGPLGEPTMMDYSDPGRVIGGRASVPTFAYSLPVADGWLVEETVLTAEPAVDPSLLAPVLAARLGMGVDDLVSSAVATETVRIPMGAPPPPPPRPSDAHGPIRFGAAAGMIHPATGYSIAGALRSAERVAAAIASALGETASGGRIDTNRVHGAVWTAAARRTRHLHDYGHDVLLRLGRSDVQQFFDVFFDLPIDTWSSYMRIDTPPVELAAAMTRMFAAAPMSLRARLVRGDPRRLVRTLRP